MGRQLAGRRATKTKAAASPTKRATKVRSRSHGANGRPKLEAVHVGRDVHLETLPDLSNLQSQPETSIPNLDGSENFSDGSIHDDLPEDIAQLIAGIPDTVHVDPSASAEDLGAAPSSTAEAEGVPADFAPASAGVVSEKMAASVLRGIGGTLASLRRCDAYKDAGENAANTCADSLAGVMNQLWAQYAPSILQSLEGKYSGFTALCFGLTCAFAPAVVADVSQVRAAGARYDAPTRAAAPAAAPAKPEPKPEPKPGVIRDGLIVRAAA